MEKIIEFGTSTKINCVKSTRYNFLTFGYALIVVIFWKKKIDESKVQLLCENQYSKYLELKKDTPASQLWTILVHASFSESYLLSPHKFKICFLLTFKKWQNLPTSNSIFKHTYTQSKHIYIHIHRQTNEYIHNTYVYIQLHINLTTLHIKCKINKYLLRLLYIFIL